MNSIATLQQKAQASPGLSAAKQVQQAAPIQITSAADLQKQVQTAVSGKQAAVETGPQMSNLAAQRAANTAALQQQNLEIQIQNQDNAQAQAEEEAFMQLNDQDFQIREQAMQVKQEFNNKLQSVFQEYEANKGQLSFEREKSLAEQAGFMLRLGNEKYLSNLKLEGARARLENDAKFKEAMMISIFKNQQELLGKDLEFRSLLRADEREFEKKLSKLDINSALALLSSELDAAATAGQYQAAQGLVSAGVQAYSTNWDSKPMTTEQATANADKYGTAGGGSDNDPSTPY